jgi:hypothetical protein
MALLAAQGGNVLRPGHSASSEETMEAADAYGIMIDQPSGDGEGYWNTSSNPTADDLQLKQELHRDMIIRDRSHPSILDWERDNGGMNPTLADELGTLESTWDRIDKRVGADRTYSPAYGFMDECDGAGCEAGNKEQNPDNPAFGAEYWDNKGTGRGLAWDYELDSAAPYLDDWRKGKAANTFGMAQWYGWDSGRGESLGGVPKSAQHGELCPVAWLLLHGRKSLSPAALLHLPGQLGTLFDPAVGSPGASLESRLRVHTGHSDSGERVQQLFCSSPADQRRRQGSGHRSRTSGSDAQSVEHQLQLGSKPEHNRYAGPGPLDGELGSGHSHRGMH